MRTDEPSSMNPYGWPAVDGISSPVWQPIESAPKDGSEFLAWDGRSVCIAEYRMAPRQQTVGGVRYVWTEDRKDGPVREDIYSHWMPMPPPPK